MQFEKSECTVREHTISSDNVLCCAETGRVVAVFYNEYDLDAVIEQLIKAKEREKIIGTQQAIDANYEMQQQYAVV